ncbi:MAG: FAD-binding oxidoreductase [Rubellimicrobium sp.]|nr:FAD-binding oxidoreductase [Rubellimicrobium sp.]
MKADVAVLGAGIVGTCVAIHLARRGRAVTLIDRGEAGGETSFGNAGLIQREGVAPYAFPRAFLKLARYGLNRSLDMRFGWSALPALAGPLARYWWHSRPSEYARIVRDYAQFIAHSVSEHAPLIEESGAGNLIARDGWIDVYRTRRAFEDEQAEAEDQRALGVEHRVLDAGELARLEPALAPVFVGAIHRTQPWTVRDPLALTQAYLRLFKSLGGSFRRGDGMTLREDGDGWQVQTDTGPLRAREVVVAMGPWSDNLMRGLGRRLPFFVKRGYHAHYRPRDGAEQRHAIHDEAGYVVAPMAAGLRLTTGAQFMRRDAPPDPAQVAACEAAARPAFPLGEQIAGSIWMGSRPCTPDMKPVIGPGHRRGLWLATGHAHHGLTLAAATGRLLAEMMTGETPFVDPAPYRMDRFR